MQKSFQVFSHSSDDYTVCLAADVTECERGLDDCNPNANCSNNFGSYDCMCNAGFTGDGFTCTGMHALDFDFAI